MKMREVEMGEILMEEGRVRMEEGGRGILWDIGMRLKEGGKVEVNVWRIMEGGKGEIVIGRWGDGILLVNVREGEIEGREVGGFVGSYVMKEM